MAFPNEDRTTTGKDGEDITSGNALLETNYTGSPYNYDFSYISPDDYYSKKIFWTTNSDTQYPYHNFWYNQTIPSNLLFPSDDQTTVGKDGADISSANAKLQASYSSSPYNYDFSFALPDDYYGKKSLWGIDETVTYLYLLNWTDFITPSNLLFPNDDQTAIGKDGEDITYLDARKELSYSVSPYNYIFKTIPYGSWNIQEIPINGEDIPFPFLPYVKLIRGLKKWNGSDWVEHLLKRFDGNNWVEHGIKFNDNIEYK